MGTAATCRGSGREGGFSPLCCQKEGAQAPLSILAQLYKSGLPPPKKEKLAGVVQGMRLSTVILRTCVLSNRYLIPLLTPFCL